MYNCHIDIVGLFFPLIWTIFECICLSCAVGFPWKPLPLYYLWCRLLIPVFVAMKLRMMPWSLYISKESWEKDVNTAVGFCIYCN